MFVYKPSLTLDSKSIPGVRYHFRRFSPDLSVKQDIELAESRSKMRDLMIAYEENRETVSDPKDDKDPAVRRNNARWVAFSAELDALKIRYERATVLRTYLTRIEGISIDGEHEQTVDELIEFGPEELAQEAIDYIRENGALTPAEKNELPSHIISSTADGMETSNIDAEPAATTDTTATATAPDTPPTE